MAKGSEEYWREREETQRQHNIHDEKQYNAEIQKIYQRMEDEIRKEINGFYGKYAAKEGITIEEARRRVSKLDMEEYSRKAKEYVANRDLSPQANEEMRLYNLTMKVNRLEMLKATIGVDMVGGFDDLEKLMGQKLTEKALSEMERQAGILGRTVQNNEEMAHAIVNASFHNAKFSDRIWMYQDMLKGELDQLLSTGLIQGKHPTELARHLHKLFGVSRYDAERLMRTEMARVQTEAQKQSLLANGFQEYEFITVGYAACPICAALDEKHFKLRDMQPGRNAPPMHPNCRCSIAAWMDEDVYNQWLDSGAAKEGVTFEEWQKNGNISYERAIDEFKKKKDGDTSDDIMMVNRGDGIGRKLNCQRCVPAYELRKRGLDVIAWPANTDSKGRLVIDDAIKNSTNVFVGFRQRLKLAGSFDGKEFIEKQLLAYGDGARVQIFVTWDQQTTEVVNDGEIETRLSGHTFLAENRSGKVAFVDPQARLEDCSDYFTKVKKRATIFARIDDLPVNEDVIDLFVANRGG